MTFLTGLSAFPVIPTDRARWIADGFIVQSENCL